MGILRFNFRSEVLSLTTNVTVCYPTSNLTTNLGFREPLLEKETKKPYKPGMKFQTVYLLHGGGEDDSVPYRYTRLEQYAERNMVMTVTPSVNDSLYTNTKYGFRYLEYLTEELPLVIQSLFASAPGRDNTFVVGLAMGGNGALGLGVIRPDLYRAVVDLSGGIGMTLDREEYRKSLHWGFSRVRDTLLGEDEFEGSEHDLYACAKRNIDEGKTLPAFHIAVGEDDFIRDRVFKDYAELRRLGYPVQYEEAQAMGHDYEMWDAYLKKTLDEWLPLHRAPIYDRP